MPKPKAGESESDFVGRCIPMVLDEGTAEDQEQAAAICYSIYREHGKRKPEDQDRFLTESAIAGKSWHTGGGKKPRKKPKKPKY